ncbi:hypothetical protein DC498_01610 [Terrimonas sp.]|uniref:hypothetical protein n=1 Tax=Terrimonas sp. TaxID=1914338 RepID=UPI000D5211FD|nr:hypothetical protein [Terrimonas sp.]PVD54113.1 hypothetical protein DC498_01610 [Terrimonas sp.]
MGKSISKTVSEKPKKGRKVKTLEDIQEDIKSKCLSIKSIIDSGNLNALKELEPLFSKAMADEIGVNHGRFSNKFRNPVKFSVSDIHRFAYYIGFEPDKLSSQINSEIRLNKSLVSALKEFRKIKELKQYKSVSRRSKTK